MPKSFVHFNKLGDLVLSGFSRVASKGYHTIILQYYSIYVLAKALNSPLLKGRKPLPQQHNQHGSNVIKVPLTLYKATNPRTKAF